MWNANKLLLLTGPGEINPEAFWQAAEKDRLAACAPWRVELAAERSDHAQLHPARFANHVLIPRRIPDELHVGLIDAVDCQNLALGVVGDGRAHSAAWCGQSHLHIHPRAAVLFFR